MKTSDIPFFDFEPEYNYLDFTDSDLDELAFQIEEDLAALELERDDPYYRLTFEREPSLFVVPAQKLS